MASLNWTFCVGFLHLSGVTGSEDATASLRMAPDTRILVLTGVRDPEVHRHTIRQGALGLVVKEKAVETLLQAITQVQAGEVWLDPR